MANQNFKQWLEDEAIPREQRLNDEIFSLLRYANEETGGNDTTLGAAMIRLVQGYGQGGGGNMRKERVLSTTIHEGDTGYTLTSPIKIDSVELIIIEAELPDAATQNRVFTCGFTVSASPITTDGQQIYAGVLNGQRYGKSVYVPAYGDCIGYSAVTGVNSYGPTVNVGYSRKIRNNADRFVLNSPASAAMDGETLAITILYNI